MEDGEEQEIQHIGSSIPYDDSSASGIRTLGEGLNMVGGNQDNLVRS